MPKSQPHRKRIKHYDELGNFHGLTFSCYQWWKLLTKEELAQANSPLLGRLTVQERPGKEVFRFWQEGPGYDRNLQTEDAVCASIDYIHMNPVRRKLCKTAADWRWSSARWYLSDGRGVDPLLPKIRGVPWGLFVK